MNVLVADDDPSSQLIVKTMLRNLGHDCRVVGDGNAAWAAFAEEEPDVIISDWMMPGLTGLELCRLVRNHGEDVGGYTYFIIVTAQDRQQDIVTGMRSGADDYLVKPLEVEDLEVRLVAAERVTDLHRQLAEQRAELVRLNGELLGLARLDPLTGLGNRLALQEFLAGLESRVERHSHTYTVALVDVDHFKDYNDHYGHLAGDHALRSVALAISAEARVGDGMFRYGGEEFLAVYPDEHLDGAAVATERIRQTVERLAIPHEGNPPFGIITVSAGLAMAGPTKRRRSDEVLKAADAAMYRAKEAGRNRLELD
jgi:two-component system cell cycle response regulator